MKPDLSNVVGKIATSHRLLALLLAISLIVAVSLVYESVIPVNTFYIVSTAIAYIVFMRLMVEAGSRTAYKLRVYREYEEPLVENKPFQVKVKIYNPTIIPLIYVEASDLYPSLFRLVKGFSKVVGLIPSKGFIEMNYVLKPCTGKHSFRGVEIVIRDPLGLFAYKTTMPDSSCTVRVYPKPYPIPPRIMRRWMTTSLGLTKSKLRGIGTEFMMLREYSYGDDYRFIDWKAYARLRRLYVKVFEREASLNLVIVLDASPAMLYGIVGKTMLEETIRVISGLVGHIVSRGDWVGLAIRGEKPVILSQGRGYIQYYRILNTLSDITWSREYPSYTMAELLKKSLLALSKRTKALFLIFMSLDPTGYEEGLLDREINELTSMINRIIALNHSVVIVSPLPGLYELELLSGIEACVYLATILKGIEATQKYAKMLRSKGVNVIQVGPSSLLPRLISFIERYRAVI